ncbi:MAG: hypothetical protein JSV53_04270 [candidate division WOR-3 bacterium]|nr:MAG: hypothetical protein JSV53_04270 [candidate division WOR-3 bacterium]
MDLTGLIMPLGIVSFGFMLLAVLTGTRVIKLKVKYHKLVALIAMIAASIHLGLVIFYNYL